MFTLYPHLLASQRFPQRLLGGPFHAASEKRNDVLMQKTDPNTFLVNFIPNTLFQNTNPTGRQRSRRASHITSILLGFSDSEAGTYSIPRTRPSRPTGIYRASRANRNGYSSVVQVRLRMGASTRQRIHMAWSVVPCLIWRQNSNDSTRHAHGNVDRLGT